MRNPGISEKSRHTRHNPDFMKTLQPYDNLVVSLRKAFAEGLVSAQKALEYHRLKTYWTIGKELNAYIDKNSDALHQGRGFFRQVSEDLNRNTEMNVSHDTIARAARFHRHYPSFPSQTSLTFTHYLALLRIPNKRARRRMEARAVKLGLSVLDLKTEISRRTLAKQKSLCAPSADKLAVERGEPFVYAVRAEKDVAGRKFFRVDCGFRIQREFPARKIKIKEGGRIVRVVKTGDDYALRFCQKARARRYTYPAVVTRVVDGDTIIACVDVGFSIWITARFRLRGINTAELKTAQGNQARSFVEGYLKDCPKIIIRSTKAGMYGRWLADIFALKKETDPYLIAREGEYFNQVLLDKGLARKYDH